MIRSIKNFKEYFLSNKLKFIINDNSINLFLLNNPIKDYLHW